jgi:hypothetical protein
MDPNAFAQNYRLLFDQGKSMGLGGSELTDFVTQGINAGKEGELERAIKPILDIRREERDPAYRQQVLKDQLAFDQARMQEAGKWKAMFDLPNTLINAYSVPSRIQAQGAADIAQLMSQGAANIPNLTNYQRGSFNFSPNRYF